MSKYWNFKFYKYEVVTNIETNGLNGNALVTGPMTFSRNVSAVSYIPVLQLCFIFM